MKTLIVTLIMVFGSLFGSPAWPYDSQMAESYAGLFEEVKGAGAGKALHLMDVSQLLDAIKSGDPVLILDIRTPAETAVIGVTVPATLTIPLSELFSEANLARIPGDRPVVIFCQSGIRAVAAGTALRHIGFDNVYILKGGSKALAAAVNPSAVNEP